MKPDPLTVHDNGALRGDRGEVPREPFQLSLRHRARRHASVGAISLHDIKSYLNEPELAELVIAGDILREDFPTIAPAGLARPGAQEFSRHDGERLPVTRTGGRLVGSISKTDLILALAEQAGQEPAPPA